MRVSFHSVSTNLVTAGVGSQRVGSVLSNFDVDSHQSIMRSLVGMVLSKGYYIVLVYGLTVETHENDVNQSYRRRDLQPVHYRHASVFS